MRTVIVYLTRSDTFTTVTLTVLLTLTSTIGLPVTFSELPLLLDLFVSFSFEVTFTAFGIVPTERIRATTVKTTFSPAPRLPMIASPVTLSYVIPLRDASNETNFKCESNLSHTTTSVAFEGPLFTTTIVYLIKSVTLATVTFTVLLTFKSTIGREVTLVILALLLEALVSFS